MIKLVEYKREIFDLADKTIKEDEKKIENLK